MDDRSKPGSIPEGQPRRPGEAPGQPDQEAELQATASKKEGGLKPGGSNTPGGALNTGPDAGGRGMGSTD